MSPKAIRRRVGLSSQNLPFVHRYQLHPLNSLAPKCYTLTFSICLTFSPGWANKAWQEFPRCPLLPFPQTFTAYRYVTLIWVLLDTLGLAYLIPLWTGLNSGVAPGTLGKRRACQRPDGPERSTSEFSISHTQQKSMRIVSLSPSSHTWATRQSVLELCADQQGNMWKFPGLNGRINK